MKSRIFYSVMSVILTSRQGVTSQKTWSYITDLKRSLSGSCYEQTNPFNTYTISWRSTCLNISRKSSRYYLIFIVRNHNFATFLVFPLEYYTITSPSQPPCSYKSKTTSWLIRTMKFLTMSLSLASCCFLPLRSKHSTIPSQTPSAYPYTRKRKIMSYFNSKPKTLTKWQQAFNMYVIKWGISSANWIRA
jgi:hypothetical protein